MYTYVTTPTGDKSKRNLHLLNVMVSKIAGWGGAKIAFPDTHSSSTRRYEHAESMNQSVARLEITKSASCLEKRKKNQTSQYCTLQYSRNSDTKYRSFSHGGRKSGCRCNQAFFLPNVFPSIEPYSSINQSRDGLHRNPAIMIFFNVMQQNQWKTHDCGAASCWYSVAQTLLDLPIRPVLLLATSIGKFGHRKLQRITKGGLRCTWSPWLTYSCHIARLTWMCCGVYRLFISMRWINYTGHMYSISPWQCHNYAEKCVPFCGKKIATYDITIPTFTYYTRRIENGGNVIRPG